MENVGQSIRSFRASLVLDEEEQLGAQESIAANAQLSFEYLFFIVLSATVATLGLITNSAPVIIGAMVLAPLMNPVLGVSLGVVRGDLPLLWRGLRTLVVGLVLGFLLASMSAWIIPDFVLNSEIMGRTRPTLYDLFIGMAAGAGGALGQARRSVAGVLPGAAIAVSLMPPLCVTGIAFAMALGAAPLEDASGVGLVYGSALLWMANLAAINLSAIAIFVLLGFRRIRADEERRGFRRRITLSIVLVLLLTIPLLVFLQQTVNQSRDERFLRQVMTGFARELDTEAEMVSVRLGGRDPVYGWRRVVVTIYSPRLPERDEVVELREKLEEVLGKVELKLTVNPVHTYRENPLEGSISDRPKPLNPEAED